MAVRLKMTCLQGAAGSYFLNICFSPLIALIPANSISPSSFSFFWKSFWWHFLLLSFLTSLHTVKWGQWWRAPWLLSSWVTITNQLVPHLVNTPSSHPELPASSFSRLLVSKPIVNIHQLHLGHVVLKADKKPPIISFLRLGAGRGGRSKNE